MTLKRKTKPDHNQKNKKAVENGTRKNEYGTGYEANYKNTGRPYIKSEHHNPDGSFKAANKAGEYKYNGKLTKDEFRAEMNKIAQKKLTPEILEDLLDQLVAMAKKGNINAIRELKDFILGKEGPSQQLNINVKKEEVVWNYGFDEPQPVKQIENETPDEENIIDVEAEEKKEKTE